jgi:lipoprotein-anchoring transpeptidase ErfK/SrfK
VLLAAAGALGCAIGDPTPPAVTRPAPPPVQLVLRLGERRLYLMDADSTAPPESFPIAVGRRGRETPTGRFKVEEKIVHPDFVVVDPADRTRAVRTIPPGPANPLGERWIGIILGDGWTIGIHGTPRPELLGKAVSGGCIRMRNADVVRIYDKVDLGTPVVIEP